MSINQQRLVDHFISLVQIDSPSGNELEICETLSAQLSELGFTVEAQAVAEEISNGYNLYARLAGSIDDSVVLSCHMDTVSPGNKIKVINQDGILRSDGTTILGGDDKSGIAAIIEAVKVLQANNTAHKTIEIAFTVHEEGGLHGSKLFDMSKITANKAIVLDSGGPIGTIITQAPGQEGLNVTIKGKPAHAGLAPEQGINALSVAATAIANMKLSRIDEETTANIGWVHGGEATNVVMPELKLGAEARSLDADKLEQQVLHMCETFESAAEQHGATVTITRTPSYSAYLIAEDDAFVSEVKRSFEQINIVPQTNSTGGGSDANIFNGKGLKTVNLSTGMAKVHTLEEYIAIKDMVAISEFLTAYLAS